MAQPTMYSHEVTVAAITSYYTFIGRIHSDNTVQLKHPPPTGWPQITHELFARLKMTDAVIEMLRHIPYLTHTACIMHATLPTNYIDPPFLESLAAIPEKQKVRPNWNEPVEKINPEDITPPHFLTLADSTSRYGSELLLDMERGVIIWCRPVSGS